MYYLDTSVLVTVLTPEPQTSTMLAWIGEHAADCVISDWVLTEFAGAVGAKSRRGDLTASDLQSARRGFDRMTAGQLPVLGVVRGDFRLAAQFIGSSTNALRAGDAVHLAVATREAQTIVTRDRRMSECAQEVEIPCMLLGETS